MILILPDSILVSTLYLRCSPPTTELPRAILVHIMAGSRIVVCGSKQKKLYVLPKYY